jgi:hypothetical protein
MLMYTTLVWLTTGEVVPYCPPPLREVVLQAMAGPPRTLSNTHFGLFANASQVPLSGTNPTGHSTELGRVKWSHHHSPDVKDSGLRQAFPCALFYIQLARTCHAAFTYRLCNQTLLSQYPPHVSVILGVWGQQKPLVNENY